MRLGSLVWHDKPGLGLVLGDKVLVLNGVAGLESTWSPLADARDVTPLWAEPSGTLIREIHSRVQLSGLPSGWEQFCERIGEGHWLPPVALPEKVICIGLNYRDHAAESGMQIPKEPIIFSKFTNALCGASGPVLIPANSSQVDYEAELAVIVGKRAKNVPEEKAMDYVAGYTIVDDVSARDWQFRSGQWLVGKSFDTFAPCGPWLVTADEVPDPHALAIRLTLNDQIMQDSNTSQMIFGIPALVSYLSQVFTLQPGDIISTGTPPGVGFARRPPVFLKTGDTVQIEIESVGKMTHRFISD